MKTSLCESKFKVWMVLLGLVLSTALARADQEQDLITILKSNATANEKANACQKLRLVGTAKSVPAIAPLLTDEHTTQAARYALEGMPSPDAVAAMRKAAEKTSGLIKAGLIDSLGWRRDTASISLLKKSLSDKDPAVASAAASSLGRIGNKKAADALLGERDNKDLQAVVLDALLRCADRLKADGDVKKAAAVYTTLTSSGYPEHVRASASRGLGK
ncbi:MAG: HEAT repeat domain-containing protein [Limisphaerales bacterium]